MALLSNLGQEKTQMLFDFKKNNNGTWKHSQASYVVEPQNTVTYSLSWQVKQRGKLHSDFADGVLKCEIPETWQVISKNSLAIVFPKAAHGKNEEAPLHSLSTFAGIYLGKSIYSPHPDVVSILWHLRQTIPDEHMIKELIDSNPFLHSNNFHIADTRLDKNNEIQLVALHLSNKRDINFGEQHWFISDALEHAYLTTKSQHNTWLPWLDTTRSEFSALTPLEAYRTTALAGLDQTKIYNRTTHSYILEQGSITNKMQMVYDIIAPLVRARRENTLPLFTHLLLKSKTGFELFGFEILENGVFDPILDEEISDPSLLGLPSAQELGFSIQE